MPTLAPMKLRVMVVDDDSSMCRAVTEAVESTADLELTACSGTLRDGLRLIPSVRPDVLLVDLGLPDGNGVELIRLAVATLPACDVMVVSVFGDEKNVLASIEAGATGYLLKDASPAEIVEQIRVIHSGGSPISAVIARQLLVRFAVSAAQLGAASLQSVPPQDDGVALSPREREVLQLSAKGYSHDEVAQMLGVSRHTVTSFVKRIYRKLQVHSKTEAVYEARRMGLLGD